MNNMTTLYSIDYCICINYMKVTSCLEISKTAQQLHLHKSKLGNLMKFETFLIFKYDIIKQIFSSSKSVLKTSQLNFLLEIVFCTTAG